MRLKYIETMEKSSSELNHTREHTEHTKEMENYSEGGSTLENSGCDYTICSNIDVEDLDQETAQKLRGDTIGDTLYSQSFVLKTLLKLSDLKWDQQFEEDLCFLWDMTVEKDVCKFLLDLSYPDIMCTAVLEYDENNRFVEIVIGILANVLCSGYENTMTREQISTVLSFIQSDDHLILIQLMRFIAVSAENTKLLFTLVDEPFLGQICFILKNSINSELLLKTIEAVAKLTTKCRINEQLLSYNLYESVMICYQTLIKTDDDYFELDTKKKLLSIKYMLETITNICTYIDQFEKCQLLEEVQKNSNIFANEVMKILSFFSHEGNLMPITDNFIFYMSAIAYICVHFKVKYIPELFLSVAKILEHIVDIRNEVEELFQSALELLCHFISCTQLKNIQKDLKLLPRHKVKKILNVVNENYTGFQSGSHINDFLVKLSSELK